MAKFEIEYSKRDTIIVEAETKEDAEEMVFSFMENDWYSENTYESHGFTAARDKEGSRRIYNEIVSVKELPETALDVMLKIIREQKLTKS